METEGVIPLRALGSWVLIFGGYSVGDEELGVWNGLVIALWLVLQLGMRYDFNDAKVSWSDWRCLIHWNRGFRGSCMKEGN